MLPALGTPDSEFPIDEELVVRLLTDQHPDLAGLPLQLVAAGWDNDIFRLGEAYGVRMPRRAIAAELILKEQYWLPRLSAAWPIPVPVPCRFGKPALGYPWSWNVVPWLKGEPAARIELEASEAVRCGQFLRCLHVPASPDAPINALRGGPLEDRAAQLEKRMQRLSERTNCITPQLRNIWNDALTAPIDVLSTWLHGDLHPGNVLVEHGVISGVIDWGDLTSGDRATDLAAIWMLFGDRQTQEQALAEYGCVSTATARRAKGWAVIFGVSLLDTGLTDNPRNAALGERILRRVANGS